MKKIISGLAFGLLVLSSPVSAYELNHVLDQIEAKEKLLSSLRFSFDQQVQFKNADLKEKVSGKASFKKPKKMIISKRSPQEQVTMTNGSKVWIYTPAYKQAWVGSAGSMDQNKNIPTGIFLLDHYVEDLRKNFSLSLDQSSDDSANAVWLTAVPKKDLGYEIKFLISAETWFPSKTIYTSDSARIETKIYNVEENPALPDSSFTFNPPKGTDLIPLN